MTRQGLDLWLTRCADALPDVFPANARRPFWSGWSHGGRTVTGLDDFQPGS